MVKTVDLVCLQHNRYWPCKELKPDEREHWWAYRTFWVNYGEQMDKWPADTVEELGR